MKKKQKFHISRGDMVCVITGNHRGSQGKVLQVLDSKCRAIIEGINFVKKHQRKTQDYPNGAIIEREGSIHVSNLKLVEKGGKGKKDKSLS